MPKRRSTSSRRPSADGAASAEVASLRAKLAAAEKAAAKAQEDRRQALQQLGVYHEEARGQAEQIIESQQLLEESRDRFASLYDFAPIGYMTLDRNGVIDEINLTAAAMLGQDRQRLVRTPLRLWIVPADRGAFSSYLSRCREGTCETELHVLSHGRPDPLPVLLRTWATASRPVPWGGRPFELRCAMLDLSERRRAQERERTYLDRLQSLSTALTLAEERERRRIAVELHDNISQSLVLLKMKLSQLRQGAAAADPKLHRMASEALDLLDPLIQSSRSLTFELSPPVLYELGFDAALEWLAESTAKRHPLEVKVAPDGQPAPQQGEGSVPHEIAVLMLQAVRELLMNVVKHAGAQHAEVRPRVTQDGRLIVTVVDDGRGFDPDRLVARAEEDEGGFGLFSIRTRLQYLGGAMGIETHPGEGSRVTLTVPLRRGGASGSSDAD